MTDQFLDSSNVTVYPASNRGDAHDRYAKLNIEHNLINIINRLTGVDSFIVEGLNVSGTSVTEGVCNIHGYLFKIGSYTLPSVENNKFLCLKIRVDKTNVNTFSLEQLSNVADGSQATDNSDTNFTGICWCTYDQAGLDKVVAPYYVLPIAKGVSGKWKEIMMEDGVGNTRAFQQLFTLDQILVTSNQAGNNYANKKQNLMNFLERNYIIDDGEILD